MFLSFIALFLYINPRLTRYLKKPVMFEWLLFIFVLSLPYIVLQISLKSRPVNDCVAEK